MRDAPTPLTQHRNPAVPEPAFSLQSIDPGQQFTWEHSNLEANKPKNRYANVIAYDHSRVILQPLEGSKGLGCMCVVGSAQPGSSACLGISDPQGSALGCHGFHMWLTVHSGPSRESGCLASEADPQ